MTTQTDELTAPSAGLTDDIAQSVETDFSLHDDGTVSLKGEKIAVLQKQDDVLAPTAKLLTEGADEKTLETVNRWVSFHLNKTLAPLFAARAALTDETMTQNARAILTQTLNRLGIIRRERLKEYLKILSSILPDTDVAVFIGPEGGFEPQEVEEAIGFGAVPVSLGKRILRTETAGIMLLSVLGFVNT